MFCLRFSDEYSALFLSSSEGGFLEIRSDDRLGRPFTPSLPPSRAMTYVDEDPPDHEYMNGGSTASTYEVPSITELRSTQVSFLPVHSCVGEVR